MAAVSIAGRGWRLHAATADPARGARNADDPDMADHVAQYAENGFTIYQVSSSRSRRRGCAHRTQTSRWPATQIQLTSEVAL
jgi:hypothetical protein|eukprot:COSAG06_NODE_118_length_23136_cov_18.029257_14_plen_82_part_00